MTNDENERIRNKLKTKLDLVDIHTNFTFDFCKAVYGFAKVVFDNDELKPIVQKIESRLNDKHRNEFVSLGQVLKQIQDLFQNFQKTIHDKNIFDKQLDQSFLNTRDSKIVVISIDHRFNKIIKESEKISKRLLELNEPELAKEMLIQTKAPSVQDLSERFSFWVGTEYSDLVNEYRIMKEKLNSEYDSSLSQLKNIKSGFEQFSRGHSYQTDDFGIHFAIENLNKVKGVGGKILTQDESKNLLSHYKQICFESNDQILDELDKPQKTIKSLDALYHFEEDPLSGVLKIGEDIQVDFEGRRALIVEILISSDPHTTWRDYKYIKTKLGKKYTCDSAQIRKDIDEINERGASKGAKKLVKTHEKPGDSRKTKEYRWGY